MFDWWVWMTVGFLLGSFVVIVCVALFWLNEMQRFGRRRWEDEHATQHYTHEFRTRTPMRKS